MTKSQLPKEEQLYVKEASKSLREKDVTPQSVYRIPILEALVEIGGKGKADEVLKKVYDKIKDRLKPGDFEEVSGGGTTMAKLCKMGEKENGK